jgi:hypothetical protein
MTDDLIFLKATGWLVLGFVLFMLARKWWARRQAAKGGWPPGEYR